LGGACDCVLCGDVTDILCVQCTNTVQQDPHVTCAAATAAAAAAGAGHMASWTGGRTSVLSASAADTAAMGEWVAWFCEFVVSGGPQWWIASLRDGSRDVCVQPQERFLETRVM
jgi:hypothetical protein